MSEESKTAEKKMHKTQFTVLGIISQLGGKMVPGPEVEKLAAKKEISMNSCRGAMYKLTESKHLMWVPEEINARQTIDHFTLTPLGKQCLKKGND